MKKLIIIIITIMLFSTTVLANSRPDYSFSDEVFKELPDFPSDFFDIKDLFSYQSITAEHLGEDYYQPELLPNWDYWAEKVYKNESNDFGSYGVFVYPSRFTVYGIEKGNIINLSMFVYAQWGIKYYQGAKLVFSEEENVDIKLVEPEDCNILLSPTAPYFHLGWIQLIKIQIHINETKNCVVQILEEKPIEEIDNEWRNTYENYTSGSSLLGQRISKCKIYLYGSFLEENNIEEKEEKISIFGLIINISIILLFILALINIRHNHDKRKRDKKQNQ